jgi:hypothetical protein
MTFQFENVSTIDSMILELVDFGEWLIFFFGLILADLGVFVFDWFVCLH